MTGEILAILTAFFWAISSILAKKGLQSSNVWTGTLLRLITSITFFGVLALFFVSMESFSIEAIFYHGIAGILGGFLGLIASFFAIKKVGVALSSTVLSSQSLFSSLAAVLLLGEIVTIPIFIGTILIVLGVAILSFKEKEKVKWLKRTMVLPILASFLYAIVAIPTKLGVQLTNSPIFGVTIETTTALACFSLLFLIKKTTFTSDKKGRFYFFLAGLCSAFGLLSLFYALNFGDVIVVIPLMGISPFFALFFTYLFLKKIEKITLKLIVATIFIVIGSTFIVSF
jgi:DME family drug/metabolite transporter